MSLATVTQSSTAPSSSGRASNIFTDLPLINRVNRLNIVELNQSDKQIVNELVYRWCRILTRNWRTISEVQVLIMDLIGSVNPIRLATILKRESGRMKLINITRQCKINSTFVTLSSHMKRDALASAPKLVVIYQDEFFIIKTMTFLRDYLQNTTSQVLLVVPKLDRQERDMVSLIHSYQIIKCEFQVNRREIGPAPPETTNDSYQSYLNQVSIVGSSKGKNMAEKVSGELREDGLHLHINQRRDQKVSTLGRETVDGLDPLAKRIKVTNT